MLQKLLGHHYYDCFLPCLLMETAADYRLCCRFLFFSVSPCFFLVSIIIVSENLKKKKKKKRNMAAPLLILFFKRNERYIIIKRI